MTFENNKYYCDKCGKDAEENRIERYWSVKLHKTITPYGIEAPDWEQVGHWCFDCWKEVGEQYKKNPIVKKYKYTGNCHKYLIEKVEWGTGLGGTGYSKEMWWHKDTQEWKSTKPTNNSNDNRERERANSNSDCWIGGYN